MPFHKRSEMQAKQSSVGVAMGKSVAGEWLKVGIATCQEDEGPPAHFHPNAAQFILMPEGRMRMVCGDEELVAEQGDMGQDYHKARDGEAVWQRLSTPG